ncbi:MAG: sigma-70 family RNA polymerase sigma factor [Lactobacillus sp.]|jgi:RNA polymerase sigma factor (sigma-70 family)|nr:sigma-70 family RNA polymerase sigma factor [Lactobacillus sp.]
MDSTTTQRAWELALANQAVIHGALKKANIWRSRPDYEDLAQEGQLVYVTCYHRFCQEHETFSERAFNCYAYQAIIWHLRNILRRDMWLSDHTQASLDATVPPESDHLAYNFPESLIALSIRLGQIQELLSQRQKAVLVRHMWQGEPLRQLAVDLDCPARTLRYDRNKILRLLR